MVKLFDAHCHLQDPRILNTTPKLIKTAIDSGVFCFAVNGVSEKDWHLVKQMAIQHPSVIPCFGVHPWYVPEKSPDWFENLKEFFHSTPSAAIGEIGLDKGSKGKEIDFNDQVETFKKQLELAKQLKKPATIHCVSAYGDLLEIMKSLGPFPNGLILHSYLGSAEMVREFASLGAYFSFSGHHMEWKENKARKMVKSVPPERILLETDAPDAFPRSTRLDSLFFVEEGDGSVSEKSVSENSVMSKQALNHPANIHNVLIYVASLLEMDKEELADLSYRNAVRVFSYEGSKVLEEGW